MHRVEVAGVGEGRDVGQVHAEACHPLVRRCARRYDFGRRGGTAFRSRARQGADSTLVRTNLPRSLAIGTAIHPRGIGQPADPAMHHPGATDRLPESGHQSSASCPGRREAVDRLPGMSSKRTSVLGPERLLIDRDELARPTGRSLDRRRPGSRSRICARCSTRSLYQSSSSDRLPWAYRVGRDVDRQEVGLIDHAGLGGGGTIGAGRDRLSGPVPRGGGATLSKQAGAEQGLAEAGWHRAASRRRTNAPSDIRRGRWHAGRSGSASSRRRRGTVRDRTGSSTRARRRRGLVDRGPSGCRRASWASVPPEAARPGSSLAEGGRGSGLRATRDCWRKRSRACSTRKLLDHLVRSGLRLTITPGERPGRTGG